MAKHLSLLLCLSVSISAIGQINPKLQSKIELQVKTIEPKIIEWRRYFHEHPELSNQEYKTGKFIADYLKSIGLEVQYPVAKTGVVALLKGSKPGAVIALRADIDGLPITERNSLPFASKERSVLRGQETGVMHACGHDAHISMLMAVAQILTSNKADLKGTVKFIFQPAEEGAYGEVAGAELMVKEGVLENPKVEVIFGLHIQSLTSLGKIEYRAGGMMAAVDAFDIKVTGVGAHGATPWDGVDPIVVASQIVSGLQTIVSRQTELTKAGVVITVGSFHSGIRRNIIPEEAMLEGTIRTFDPEMQQKIHDKIRLTATKIAESAGAKAEVTINKGYPVTYNDPTITKTMVASLERAAGVENVSITQPVTMAEDFSFFQQKVPGLFFFLGAYPAQMNLQKQPTHHTADFMIDERAFVTGTQGLLNLTLDYMFQNNSSSKK
jgi:amidohydrolase